MVRVRVRQDYRWPRVRVDGREFFKSAWVHVSGEELSEEILESTLLEVEEPTAEVEGAGPAQGEGGGGAGPASRSPAATTARPDEDKSSSGGG